MTGLRCSSLLLLSLSLLLSLAVAGRDGLSHSTRPSSRCLSVRSELFGGKAQYSHESCAASSARSSSPSSSSLPSGPARVDAAPYPPSVTPDAAWMPEQAIAVYVQGGYWYVAIGLGVDNSVSHTLLKVDAATHLPVSNVTLNSSSEIVTMVGNGTHLFVQVYNRFH